MHKKVQQAVLPEIRHAKQSTLTEAKQPRQLAPVETLQPGQLTLAGTQAAQPEEERPSIVRTYKDTLFRMIFKDKEELLSLYNAVNDTQYTDPSELEVTTLENAVYMNVKNDVSCILDMRLNLYEHQSTVNPNMPLRDLFYVTKQFQKLVVGKDIYASKQISLPTPQFIVFYNGKETQPERKILRLSDAFTIKSGEINLDLVVTQLNINPGYNEELKKKCPTLFAYTCYVERVRLHSEAMPLPDAVNKAVEECIREDILADFLRKNKAEVIYMSIFEYDEKLHERTLLEEGIEIGEQRGEQRGIEIGKQHGIEIGEKRGMENGARKAIMLLRSLGHTDSEIRAAITAEYNLSPEQAEQYIGGAGESISH